MWLVGRSGVDAPTRKEFETKRLAAEKLADCTKRRRDGLKPGSPDKIYLSCEQCDLRVTFRSLARRISIG